MQHSKIGFHTAVTGNRNGIGEWMERLNAAGIPVGIKASDDYGMVQEVIDSGARHGVTNWPIYRRVLRKPDDVPNYYIHPHESARNYWQLMISYDGWPPELDKEKAWIDVINEIRGKPDPDRPMFNDMHPVDWMGEFACEIGRIALRDNWKVCLPSFNSGEPEPEAWNEPGMVKFLTMCGEYPDQIALSVHEYVWDMWKTDPNPENWYPYSWGRFENAIAACDRAGISRDITIFITEGAFGHDGDTIPPVNEGMGYLDWYNKMSARFPQVKFLAFWALDGGYGNVANEVQPYIEPLTTYGLSAEFDAGKQPAITYLGTLPSDEPVGPPIDPPDGTTKEKIFALSQSWAFPVNENAALQKAALADGFTPSGNERWEIVDGVKYAVQPFYKIGDTNSKRSYYAVVGAWDDVMWTDGSGGAFAFTHWPTLYKIVNQLFGADPDYYRQFGLPGHEGTDIRAYHGDPIYAIADGIISQVHGTSAGSNYGIYIRVAHADDYETTYAHLDRLASGMHVNERVNGGQIVGYADNTGNSSWSHLHLTLKRRGHTYTDTAGNVWPYDIHDSDRFLRPFTGVTWPDEPAPPIPPPPTGKTVAIAPYFEPVGDVGVYTVFHFDAGNTQPQQMIRQGDGRVVMFKGEGQWINGRLYQDYEQWQMTADGVRKHVDTSDAGHGGLDAYDLGGTAWLPAVVEVGKVYTSSPTVKRFNRATCEVHSNEKTTDYLYIREIIPHWVSPKNAGITFDDVLVVEWRKTADISEPPVEVYKFAKGVGYCEWGGEGRNGAAIGELPQGRQPLSGELTGCV